MLHILRICAIFMLLFISFSRVDAHEASIKGLRDIMADPNSPASLIPSVLALDYKTLEYIRFLANYGSYDDKKPYPILSRADEVLNEAARKNDAPQDWVTSLIQFLFPSAGANVLVPSTRGFAFSKQLTIAEIGGIMQVLLTEDRKNKPKLAGAILAVFQPKTLQQKYDKALENEYKKLLRKKFPQKAKQQKKLFKGNLKNILLALFPDEAQRLDKLDSADIRKFIADKFPEHDWVQVRGQARQRALQDMGKVVVKTKMKNKNLHKNRNGIIRLIVEAVQESDNPESPYPPNIVEVALGALAWMKADHKKDLIPYFEAMPKLLAKGVLDDNGKFINPEAWSELKYTKEEYDEIKSAFGNSVPENSDTRKEAIKKIVENPEFAAFIGLGYNMYETVFPPISTYGSVLSPFLKHKPKKEKRSFSDCGSHSWRGFIENMIFNSDTRMFEVTLLEEIAKRIQEKEPIDINFELQREGVKIDEFEFIQEEMKKYDSKHEMERLERLRKLISKWHPLKRMIWFFKRYPRPTRSSRATNDWGLLTSNHEGVEYAKEDACEIEVGIYNMLTVVAKMTGDTKLLDILNLDQYQDAEIKNKKNKANARGLDRLCDLFTSDRKKLNWSIEGGANDPDRDTDIDIQFAINSIPAFTWSFERGHFEIKKIRDKSVYWHLNLHDEMLKKYFKGINVYIMKQFLDMSKFNDFGVEYPDLFWALAYSDLITESTKRVVVTHIFSNKKRKLYDLAFNILDQLPIDDTRIRMFVTDRIIMDIEAVPEEKKEHVDTFILSMSDQEIADSIKEGYVGIFNKLKELKVIDDSSLDIAKRINSAKWLLYACSLGNVDIIKYLLDLGADMYQVNDNNESPIYIAAKNGHKDAVELFFERGVSLEKVQKGNRSDPMNAAISENYVDIVKYLLEKGYDLGTKYGVRTTLSFAVDALHPETVKALLSSKQADERLKSGKEPYLLHQAAKQGLVDILDMLINAGLEINSLKKRRKRDRLSYAPIHLAAEVGHAEVVQKLIGLGADINKKNNSGDTPLHIAAKSKNPEIIRVLLENGATSSLDVTNKDGLKPLDTAVFFGQPQVLRALLDGGAKFEMNERNSEALAEIAQHSSDLSSADPEKMSMLVRQGYDLSVKIGKQNRSLLHFAVAGDNWGVVDELIALGADVNAVDSEGKKSSALSDSKYYKKNRAVLANIEDKFVYPDSAPAAMDYLNTINKLFKTAKLPGRLLTFWANDTLAGRYYGLRDELPNEDELETILNNIVISAKGREYQENDEWFAWTIFKNDFDNLEEDEKEHLRQVYTFTRYAQMKLADMKNSEIDQALAADDRAYNDLKLAGHANIKKHLDFVIGKYLD